MAVPGNGLHPAFGLTEHANLTAIICVVPGRQAIERVGRWLKGKLVTMKPMNDSHLAILRRHMAEVVAIHADLAGDDTGRAVLDERVMAALRKVPRHLFVPEPLAPYAYQDMPLPIGFDKTISQPFIVALMTDLLGPQSSESVLEVGTGLGYQTAVLAELAGQVWSIEIIEEFAELARDILDQLGYAKVEIRVGDGTRGWREHAPFDKILVAAAAEQIPAALLDQLKPGGRLVMPLGDDEIQQLTVVEKSDEAHVRTQDILPVRFGRLEEIT